MPNHLSLLDFIPFMFVTFFKTPQCAIFFHPPVISFFLDPHVLLSTLFSNLSLGYTQNEIHSIDVTSVETLCS